MFDLTMDTATIDLATTKQRPPIPNDLPDIDSLILADMKARSAVGLEHYGVMLQPENGRDPLIDAYQEAIDLAKYLRQALYEKYGR